MQTSVELTPDLEQFALDCVTAGRYDDVSEVVQSALRLLRDAEQRRADFRSMLEAAEEESDRDGDFALETALQEGHQRETKLAVSHPMDHGGTAGGRAAACSRLL